MCLILSKKNDEPTNEWNWKISISNNQIIKYLSKVYGLRINIDFWIQTKNIGSLLKGVHSNTQLDNLCVLFVSIDDDDEGNY
ncbi:hypothetical protein BLOT_014355 [Blomia tropicalis]|nr:hypothetical protein BLOT_014355 [Blomia tropicalis]